MQIKIASDVCRTCLKRKANILIFDNKQLINKLTNVTQIEIENNGLPDKMCAECVEKLTFCYDFQKQCKSVDNQLQSFVQRIESKFDEFVQIKSSQLKNIEIPKRKTVNNKSKRINGIFESGELIENPLHFEEVTIIDIDELGNNIETENTEIHNVADIENESEIKEESISFEEYTFNESHSICDDENVIVNKQQSSPEESTPRIASKLVHPTTDNEKQKLVHNPVGNICLICGKIFRCKTNFKRHVRMVHERKRDFKCDFCKQEFTQKLCLLNHIVKYHSINDDEKRQFIQSKLLHNPNESICLICARIFRCRSNLRRHVNFVHEGKRDFKCAICKRNFAAKTSLKNHMAKMHLKFDDQKMIVDKEKL